MQTVARNKFSTKLHPQYIKDSAGSQMVVLSQGEYITAIQWRVY